MARSLSNAYWQAYAVGTFRSPIGDRTHGGAVDLDHERIKRREVWLRDSLATVARMGAPVRRAFNQLVIDVNPDCGPLWLDQLVWSERHGLPGDAADRSSLRAALDALELLCGHAPAQGRIVYVREC